MPVRKTRRLSGIYSREAGKRTGESQVFITQGDIVHLCADAIAVTAGLAFSSLTRTVTAAPQPTPAGGGASWAPLPGAPPRPRGVVFVANSSRRTQAAPDEHPAAAMVRTAVAAASLWPL